MNDFPRFVLFLALALPVALVSAAEDSAPAPTHKDLLVATVDGIELKLDLYMPGDDMENPPLVIYIHGVGWRNGSYTQLRTNPARVSYLVNHGFAVASIAYRLTDKAKFPAQLHDCKAAVRWLRAHAEEYGYDASQIGVAGTSAGGHLATMLGVTGRVKELEGDVGGNLDQSSTVQAVVDYYGAMDFILRSQNQQKKTEPADSVVHLLIGGAVRKNGDKARIASPVTHVSEDDPPLLVIHGDQDTTVLPDQAERIMEEYEKAGLEAMMELVPGAGHGGKECFAPKYQQIVVQFLNDNLRVEVGLFRHSVFPVERLSALVGDSEDPHLSLVNDVGQVVGKPIQVDPAIPTIAQSPTLGIRTDVLG